MWSPTLNDYELMMYLRAARWIVKLAGVLSVHVISNKKFLVLQKKNLTFKSFVELIFPLVLVLKGVWRSMLECVMVARLRMATVLCLRMRQLVMPLMW